MNEDHVNSRQDLEKLQQKVDDYKKILTTLKNESSIDERNHFKEQISMMKKLMETTHHEQNTKIQKYEEEISILSTQLDSLNHTVLELTEKIESVMNTVNQDKPPSRTTEAFTFLDKSSSMPEIPSFKQLQNLLSKPQSIEQDTAELEKDEPTMTPQQADNRKKSIQNSPFPPALTPKKVSQKAMPNLNKPSAEKKFSVKLPSMNDLPLANSLMSNDSTHLKVNDTLNKQAINEIEAVEEISNKEVTVPEHKHLSEDHQPKNEQRINPSAQIVEPPSKNNMSSSLLNFFRKK